MKTTLRLSAIALAAGFAALTAVPSAEARASNRIIHIDEQTGQGYWDGRHDGIVCSYRWEWRYSSYAGRWVNVRTRNCGRYW